MPPENVSTRPSTIACKTDTVKESFSRIFTPKTAASYTYVFNCGGETRYSQDDSIYALRSNALTETLARECARRRVPAYIELSTGMVYKPPSSATIAAGGCSETAPLKPWLKLAKQKLIAEELLEKIARAAANRTDGFEAVNSTNGNDETNTPELRYAILRLPHVYGEYDVGFLARGLCLARVYQSKDERMQWLYGKDLRVNTVHVHDACHAAWLAAQWAARVSPSDSELAADRGGRVFNVSDDGDTKQEDIAQVISAIFDISTGFQSQIVSAFARFNLDRVVDDINDDMLQPWADLLQAKNITRAGPIGPFMERDLLKDCDLCLNNERAKRVLGWRCVEGREKLSEERVREVVRSYERMGWWP
jgi:nucleoside-diphosphate-sugar epimerase